MTINPSKFSLAFFITVAVIGTMLRSVNYLQLPFAYMHLVHAHSHVAFQGWVYTAMMLLLAHIFLPKNIHKKGRYALQFYATIMVVVGVLISFALQGYGLYSIVFSSLFQLLNYWFTYRFLTDAKRAKTNLGLPFKFVKTAMIFGVLSTLMPYAIGVLSANGQNGTEAYQALVYTFLHLQYNGWFLFAVLGLFFHFLSEHKIAFKQKFAMRFYTLFTAAVIPAISLSFLGMAFANYALPFAILAAVLLAASLVYFVKSLSQKEIEKLPKISFAFRLFFYGFLISFILKITLQCLSIFPLFKPYAFQNKPIILAYLHLSLIGSISFLLLALMVAKKWLPQSSHTNMGSTLLAAGFVGTEVLLALRGMGVLVIQPALIFGSATMVLGILLLLLSPPKQTL